MKTYRVKHKGYPTVMIASAEGYETTKLWARRVGTKIGFPLISFKTVKRNKSGRFE